ncbi:MAG: gliding motility-associated ABC transporter ATP-binding subunit GldA [Flavobacteriales bacterium]|nr:gliding motility-associated ABC transporter ATP-binding subunit GldA [Bacteroidota bacterium]MCB9241283.1 gliding motility-associated ABC transporter ATP-binding subunit GldA [Flavobacteriales bacterium]
MSVQVSSLTRKYNQQVAVNGISFEIPSGQVVGFLGPNGAGKSTTMKMLTGYVAPTSGTAKICGIDVSENPTEVKRRIGYLPEHNPLYLDMYVREYLQFMGRLAGIGRKELNKQVEAMIDRTGLRPEAQKKIAMLSKGYRQRVGLAQALLHNPDVLILDEPTSGLDPNQVAEIRDIIREIGRDRTVMLSTHIMQEVEAVCDRVIIINKGNIVADDTVQNLGRNTTERILFIRFKSAPVLAKINKLAVVSKVEKLTDNALRISTTNLDQLQEELFAMAVKDNNIVLEQREEAPSLEHVFKAYTKK